MNSTDIPEHDAEPALVETVTNALADKATLKLCGSGSKAFYGPTCSADRDLDLTRHQGVTAYEPTELAITVRAGTPLSALEALLAAQQQQLPFEPPHFGPAATVGGMVACGLSGPRRPWAGAVRDAVLGVRIINGRAEALSFGGQVMKNVAGYDLSRLMAGSMGTLGVLLQVSLKVLPRPVGSLTLRFALDGQQALAQTRQWARQPLPITASCQTNDALLLRLEGGERALEATSRRLGGEPVDEPPWPALREQGLAFFQQQAPLWRLSLPPATPWIDGLPGEQLLEWGGAQRWLVSDAPADQIRELARAAGGHAALFRQGPDTPSPTDGPFMPLTPVLQNYHQRLKQSLDPQGLFNPGRLYPDL